MLESIVVYRGARMTLLQTETVATPDEILRAQDESGVEYVGGQFVEKPVSNISSYVAARITFLLNVEAEKVGNVCVYDSSMGYQCYPDDPAKFRKPDGSAVLSERMKDLPDEVGLMPIPADLAIEVNSPNDLVSAVEEKVDEYLDANFKIVWVVDPPTKTVTVYRADGTTTRLREHQEISGEGALPTFKCKVGEFFRIHGK
jgi:Uma2 family endonuclease